VFNIVRAGRGVPVRFSLGGFQGFGIVMAAIQGPSGSRATRPRRTLSRSRRRAACCSITR
jgi:hypothetical protein